MRTLVILFMSAGLFVAATGCRQDMHDQAKFEPLEKNTFFTDSRSERPMVEGTVARGNLREDTVFYTGKDGDKFVETIPMEVTETVLKRGQERYNIYCTPCHDHVGSGQGMAVRRGFKQPPSFHIERLRTAAHGYYFDVISNGFATMSSYAEQVHVQDRWAIIAYIRALQLSQNATLNDVPDAERSKLEAEKK